MHTNRYHTSAQTTKMKYFSKARGDIYSRKCPSCADENPPQRAACIPCGHVICSKCADSADKCPICEKRGNSVLPFNHIRLRENENHIRECPICLDESPIERVFVSKCGHIVCFMCALRLTSCTFCSAPFCDINNKVTVLNEPRTTSKDKEIASHNGPVIKPDNLLDDKNQNFS